MIHRDQLQAAYDQVRSDLLAERTADRHWEGELSSSPLSTATAISALAIHGRQAASAKSADAQHIERAIAYLLPLQNDDGGWGDTDKSHSNISTTMLVIAAIHLADRADLLASVLARADGYVAQQGGLAGLRRRYGKDKTFAVPILTNCALAGLVDWSEVSPLPFELACVPQRFYHWTRMPVVSYAVPALVAIGQARFFHLPPRMPWMYGLRKSCVNTSLRVLARMQPQSGGYLEAVPLTSFVAMSLAATGRADHPVTQRGLEFIRHSVRADGSLPIDTNLATWTTTLAINALASAGDDPWPEIDLDWLLSCQHRERHPFTGAAPGGWGWTDLSGAVPDADDTAGALLALHHLVSSRSCEPQQQRRIRSSAALGLRWLLDLQNRDGGWPTFCRGWGKLPFDRSAADLTAHALRALARWRVGSKPSLCRRIDRALNRGWRYLQQVQRADGSWVPLWFGHQDHPAEENPVFGTARVLQACQELGWSETSAARRGYIWLESVQQPDGGWRGAVADSCAAGTSGPSSVEETALAVDALLGASPQGGLPAGSAAVSRGLNWLIQAVFARRHLENAPIGFYFAKLWYHERLYPLVFAAAALGHAVQHWMLQTATCTSDTPDSSDNRDTTEIAPPQDE